MGFQMSEFIVGQQVKLASGGAKMTIEALDEDSAECVWLDDSNLCQRGTFMFTSLRSAEPNVWMLPSGS